MSRMIKVILWGEEVGRLLWDERRHLSYFTFNPCGMSGDTCLISLSIRIF